MNDRLGRFPRAVYGVGDEPDVRFSLANERTFLAWIRTSLALLAVGVALEALDLHIEPTLRRTATLIFMGMGALVPLQAWFGWMRVERAMRRSQPLPAAVLAAPVAVGTLVASLVLVAGFLNS